MAKKFPTAHLGPVVVLGAVWGLSEALLGMWLRQCASFASGSIMTGAAFFFMAAAWLLTKNAFGIALLVAVASLFKMFDALLLSLPFLHGAVAHPIFAFVTEGLAFFILLAIARESLKKKAGGQALLGGLAALVAINLFPLVKYATGIPACVFPGTSYPLSLYYAPLAVGLSFLTVPLGFLAGAHIEALDARIEALPRRRTLHNLVSPAVLVLCLGIIALVRLG